MDLGRTVLQDRTPSVLSSPAVVCGIVVHLSAPHDQRRRTRRRHTSHLHKPPPPRKRLWAPSLCPLENGGNTPPPRTINHTPLCGRSRIMRRRRCLLFWTFFGDFLEIFLKFFSKKFQKNFPKDFEQLLFFAERTSALGYPPPPHRTPCGHPLLRPPPCRIRTPSIMPPPVTTRLHSGGALHQRSFFLFGH